jgi:hypothetical protein
MLLPKDIFVQKCYYRTTRVFILGTLSSTITMFLKTQQVVQRLQSKLFIFLYQVVFPGKVASTTLLSRKSQKAQAQAQAHSWK